MNAQVNFAEGGRSSHRAKAMTSPIIGMSSLAIQVRSLLRHVEWRLEVIENVAALARVAESRDGHVLFRAV